MMLNKPIIDQKDATLKFEDYLKFFLETYRNRVREYYHEEYDKKPYSYKFMEPIKLTVVFGNFQYTEIFSVSESGKDEVEIRFEIYDNWDDFKSAKNLPEHIQEERIKEKINVKEGGFIKLITYDYGFDIKNPEFFLHDHFTIESAQNQADSDHTGYEFEMAMKNYFVPKDVFDEYDPNVLISMVNDDNFEYEYTEAIKAFECRLYLASISMSGVSLETLLKISLERNGITYGQKDMLGKLIEIAAQNRVLRRREASSLAYFKELRNASAHGNTGRFTKTDAEFNLRKLYEIGTLLFE